MIHRKTISPLTRQRIGTMLKGTFSLHPISTSSIQIWWLLITPSSRCHSIILGILQQVELVQSRTKKTCRPGGPQKCNNKKILHSSICTQGAFQRPRAQWSQQRLTSRIVVSTVASTLQTRRLPRSARLLQFPPLHKPPRSI
jgi:hypothetical protein